METTQPLTNVCLSFNCPVKWDEMKSISNSNRHCEQCQRVVTDFRNASQQEFEVAIKESGGHLCGRFKKSQLGASFLAQIATAAALVACNNEQPVKPDHTKELSGIFLNEFASDTTFIADTMAFELTGIVFIPDSLDTQNHLQKDQ